LKNIKCNGINETAIILIIFLQGCYDSILDLLLQYNDYIIGVAAAVGALQVCTNCEE
jgi:predicted translin family RNA/ssDNA-binding protein